MVSSSQHLASQVGLTMLADGGNAIDAAVAMGYALAVVHPAMGNLGGGGFMLIHLASGKNVFLNFRERAPAKLRASLFLKKGKVDRQLALHSYLAMGVPGTVMGLNTALKQFGTMSLKAVIQPAIRLARNGFRLRRGDMRFYRYGNRFFAQSKHVAAIFMPNGKPLRVGQKLVQKQLARTLGAIAYAGNNVFYRGWIAHEIVDAAKRDHGVVSLADFAHYRVTEQTPIRCQYRGYTIVTSPPPSSGVTICQILGVVSHYPLAKYGLNSALATHFNAEAMRFAFLDRNRYLGDPRFVHNPIKALLSQAHFNQIRKQIHPFFAGKNNPTPGIKTIAASPNTTNYVVSDKYGNVVDVTYTLNGFFGNKKIAGNTGFFLNNEMDDFAIQVGKPNQFQLHQGSRNQIAPGKQPLSSMSPTFVFHHGKLILALGAAGGSTIITSIVETIEHVIDYHMNLNAAVNYPRFHMQAFPNKLYYEPNAFSADTLAKLHLMGYQLKLGSFYRTPTWGQVAAIAYHPATQMWFGANDNRRPAGLAIGLSHKS